MTSDVAISIHFPPDRFYWCVIDTRDLPGRGLFHRLSREQLRFAFEPLLPLPLEDVEVVSKALADGRCLGCAIERSVCEMALDNGALTFGPTAIPADLHLTSAPPPESFNFLRGALEPRPIRRLRRHWSTIVVIAALVALLLINLGLNRRLAVVVAATDDLAALINDAYQDAVGHLLIPGGQPPAIILTGELRRLRQTRNAAQDPSGSTIDAGSALMQLLSRWPHEVHALTESIVASPPTVTVTCLLPDAVEAQRMAAALSTVEGWQARQPQVRTHSGSTRLVLNLEIPDPTIPAASGSR